MAAGRLKRLLDMDKIFKRPFLWPGIYIEGPGRCQFLFWLTKNSLW